MKEIKELINLCPPENKSFIKKVMSGFNKKTKTGKLYYGIASGKFKADDQAMRSIYGSTSSAEKYNKLKQRLFDTLLQAILLKTWNEDRFANYREAFCTSHIKHSLIKILLSRSARSSAIFLSERYIQYSIKFEITHLTLSLANDLRNHYGILGHNKKKYLKYDCLYDKTEKTMAAEALAARTLSSFNFIEKREWETGITESVKTLKKRLSKLDQLFEKQNSYRFLLYYCGTKTRQFQYENKSYAIIPIAKSCLSKINQKPFKSEIAFYTFNRRMAESYFNMGKIPKAIDKITEAESNTRIFTNNWYTARYFKVLFYIHNRNYKIASSLESDTFHHQDFNIPNPALKEFWLVLQTYIIFLRSKNKVSIDTNNFKVNQYLTSIPIYRKDKQGRNVAILLVQLLFILLNQNYDRYIDRLDALKQYKHRHLKEPNTYRANCIIRMMIKVGKYSFHPLRVGKYTEKDFAKLKSTPPQMIASPSEVEIIRYEDMWQMVMEMLKANYRKIHY